MILYRTRQGDMLDAICKAHYGNEDMVEPVYDANPRLAELGPILPMGVEIVLPELSAQTVARPIRLWGKRDAG
jgi:phage tail protein X